MPPSGPKDTLAGLVTGGGGAGGSGAAVATVGTTPM